MISPSWLVPFGIAMVVLGVVIGWWLTAETTRRQEREYQERLARLTYTRDYMIAHISRTLYREIREQHGGLMTPSQLDEWIHAAILTELARIDRQKVSRRG